MACVCERVRKATKAVSRPQKSSVLSTLVVLIDLNQVSFVVLVALTNDTFLIILIQRKFSLCIFVYVFACVSVLERESV